MHTQKTQQDHAADQPQPTVQQKPKSQPKGQVPYRTREGKLGPIQSKQGRKPPIRAKQRPVIRNKKKPASQEGLFDRYYDEAGNYLFDDDKKTDAVKIVSKAKLEAALKNKGGLEYLYDETKGSVQEKLKILQQCAVGLQEADLSARAYSRVYTDILEKAGYDMLDVKGEAVSVRKGKDQYNNPSDRPYASTSVNGAPFRMSVNQESDDAKTELTTVANIVNALGAHEYTGHGMKHYKDANHDHRKAYETQFNHPSWESTTPFFKYRAYKRYKIYLIKENQSPEKIREADRLIQYYYNEYKKEKQEDK